IHPATLRRLKAAGQVGYVAIGRGGYRRADLIAYRDQQARRQPAAISEQDREPESSPKVVPLHGWNPLTRRPFGLTAGEWRARGMTGAEWEASQQQSSPRRKRATR